MHNIQQHKDTYVRYNLKYTSNFRNSLFSTTICGGIGIIIALLYYLCKNVFSPEAITIIYTEHIFYYINMPLKIFSLISPFSVGEFLLYLSILLILISITRTIIVTVKMISAYRRIKAHGCTAKLCHSFKPLAALGFRLTSLACVLISIFIIFGGINYTGLTYAERVGFDMEAYTKGDLKSLCIHLGLQASNARKDLKLNLDGTINENYPGYNPYKLIDDAQIAYKNIPDNYSVTKRDFPDVKYALGSHLMSNVFITGIYPYLFPEAIVNIETPIMSLPHTICHEMAHQRGFAREDEANFISYIACINSENPLLRYSGYYVSFSYAMDELYIYDKEAWNEILLLVDRGILLDINRETAYWDTFDSGGSELSKMANDAFLSTMDDEDGIDSYNRVVDLLIADAKRLNILN